MSTDNQVAMQIIDSAMGISEGKQVALHVEGMDKLLVESVAIENLSAARVTVRGGRVFIVPLSRIVSAEVYKRAGTAVVGRDF